MHSSVQRNCKLKLCNKKYIHSSKKNCIGSEQQRDIFHILFISTGSSLLITEKVLFFFSQNQGYGKVQQVYSLKTILSSLFVLNSLTVSISYKKFFANLPFFGVPSLCDLLSLSISHLQHSQKTKIRTYTV